MWIHKGVQPFGGGNNNILIHTGQAANYIADGILEETLVHEASHTSLDLAHALAPGWVAAQSADPDFISTYARDNPTREDIAESFLTYLAVKYRSGRISSTLKNTILQTIPNRIAYFEQQQLNLYPITTATDSEKIGIQLHQNHPNPFSSQTNISFDLADPTFASLSVSNLQGQVVKTLSNAYLESGNYRFSWDGTDQNGRPVSSGAYFYQLETTRSRITKTLIVVH
ncbi:MAG: T9SS type A sorting domain-containing protein [Bacteroidetes bacterium]|nr:T9SS type A sorting domain-containing protein [Bacteroidota bacterium]